MLFVLVKARRYARAALALGLLLEAASAADREPRFSQLQPDQLTEA